MPENKTLSEIALAYDWSIFTKPAVEEIAANLPLAVPVVATIEDALTKIEKREGTYAEKVAAYRKSLEAVAKARSLAAKARESLEDVIDVPLAEYVDRLQAENVKACNKSRTIIESKARFLADIASMYPLEDAEKEAVKAFQDAVRAKISESSIKISPTGRITDSQTAIYRKALTEAGYVVGSRGRLSQREIERARTLLNK